MTNLTLKNHFVILLYDIFCIQNVHFWNMRKERINKLMGQRLIDLRGQKGWSQSDFARVCNKDRQAIEKLENGKVNPTLYTLFELSQALEIPLCELMKLEFDELSEE